MIVVSIISITVNGLNVFFTLGGLTILVLWFSLKKDN